MGTVFFDCGVSLDGYFAGLDRGPHNPMGGVSGRIHAWMWDQVAFWEYLGAQGGTSDGEEGVWVRESIRRTGAFIMGKRMFEEGEVHWPNDLYKADVFVLTHEQRKPWVQDGSTTFYFVNDGIHSALDKARQSAGGKDVRIQGGADTIQQFLLAGLIDEFSVHIAPVFLGSGLRLWDAIDRDRFDLTLLEALPSEKAVHVRYRVEPRSSDSGL